MRISRKLTVLTLCLVLVSTTANAITASPKCVSMLEETPGLIGIIPNTNPQCPTAPEPTPERAPTSVPVQGPEPTSAATPRPTAIPTQTATHSRDTGITVKSGVEAELVAQVNAERANAGLSRLRVDAELTRAARVRAEEIVQSFSHTRPDGTAWSTVSGAAYGENIAMGQSTVDKVMAAWMSSQGHRENILRASFGSIGVCAVVADGVTYWVQLFGK